MNKNLQVSFCKEEANKIRQLAENDQRSVSQFLRIQIKDSLKAKGLM